MPTDPRDPLEHRLSERPSPPADRLRERIEQQLDDPLAALEARLRVRPVPQLSPTHRARVLARMTEAQRLPARPQAGWSPAAVAIGLLLLVNLSLSAAWHQGSVSLALDQPSVDRVADQIGVLLPQLERSEQRRQARLLRTRLVLIARPRRPGTRSNSYEVSR